MNGPSGGEKVWWLVLVWNLTTSVASAFPPEGFENYAILNRGFTTGGLSTSMMYSHPVWTGDYESFDVIGNVPIGNDVLTFGGRATVANYFGDRTAYFARYDWTWAETMGMSFKWAHEDWKYISTSKDAFGGELNFLWPMGEAAQSGLYFTVGANYRYIKQRWDSPWWAPLNTNTKDREWFFVGCLGYKFSLGKYSFWTLDANTRDAFGYYALDNVAFDTKFYVGSQTFLFNILFGVRTSATWVGTMYPSNYYGGIGFTVY
jgi:hypothetical protein